MQHFLVIDEETFVREALQRVLAAPCVTVTAASDAEAGLAVLRDKPVDLVIIEAVLSGIGGVTVIKEIRRKHADLPIIAISGGGKSGLEAYKPDAILTSAYLAACQAAGANAILAKPFETAELRATITRLLTIASDLSPPGR